VVSDGKPFSIPGDKIIPFLAIAIVLWILWHATLSEFGVAGTVLIVASLLYLLRFRSKRSQGS
jgi:RsiW-degrading membrane proteinase PrsW (M82 family)